MLVCELYDTVCELYDTVCEWYDTVCELYDTVLELYDTVCELYDVLIYYVWSISSETPKRRSTVRTDEATMDEIKELMALMSANDWRDRYKGITTLLEMCESNQPLISNHVVKVHKISLSPS